MVNTILLGIVLMGCIVVYGQPILAPLLFAVIISLALYPIVVYFERYTSSFCAILSSIVLFMSCFGVFIFVLFSELFQLYTQLPELQKSLMQHVNAMRDALQAQPATGHFFQSEYIQAFVRNSVKWITESVLKGDYIQVFMRNLIRWISGSVFQAIWTSGIALVTAVFIIFYIFFMLYYRNHFKKGLLQLIGNHNNITHIVDDAQHMISRYLLGIVNVMIILFFFNMIGLSIIGVEYSLLWAAIGSFGYIVPYIGIIVAAILPVIFTLLTSKTIMTPFFVLVLFVVNQLLENNILTPYIVGYHIRMNPLMLMVAFVVGGYAWGIAGMILFVPLVGIVQIICRHFPQTQPIAYIMKRPID